MAKVKINCSTEPDRCEKKESIEKCGGEGEQCGGGRYKFDWEIPLNAMRQNSLVLYLT